MNLEQEEKYTKLYELNRCRKTYAFILWFFGGAFGLHRLYLGDYLQAYILAAITLFTLGLGSIFGLIDGINIPGRVAVKNHELKLLLTKEIKKVEV